jgi:tRNA A-37 threonylcarbamoyl transferase component Bud32
LIKGVEVEQPEMTTSLLPDENFNWQAFDLLMVDIGKDKPLMKSMFARLQQAASLPPVIFFDTSATVEDAVEMMRLGADDYVDKRGLNDERLLKSLLAVADKVSRTDADQARQSTRESTASQDPNEITGVMHVSKAAEVSKGQPGTAEKAQHDTMSSDDDDISASLDAFLEKQAHTLPGLSLDLRAYAADLPFSLEDIEQKTAILGDYRVLNFLGAGSTTLAFKVESLGNHKVYALKMLYGAALNDKSAAERFKREFNSLQHLNHKHVAKLIEQNTVGERRYTVMEYYPEGDLKSRMTQRLPRETAIHYAAQIAAGLHAAHKHGLVHRDLKPGNILFRADGTLILVDFGIAKMTTGNLLGLTEEGKMVGTPYYVSPEQAKGGELDGRSDLYALGVILFEMLEARRPFVGDTPIDVMFAHVQQPVPKLTQEWDKLNEVLQRLLAKDANDRFDDGLEVVRPLHSICPECVDSDLLFEQKPAEA